LAAYYEAPGARQVERLVKSAQFSLDTAPSPSPATNKRRKFSASGEIAPHGYLQPQMRPINMGRGGSSFGPARRGRGGYNKNFRSNPNDLRRSHDVDNRRPFDNKRSREYEPVGNNIPDQSPVCRLQRGMPEEMAIVESTPPAVVSITPGSARSAPSASGSSSVVIKPWSPIKGRVLDWKDL
jgi:hypothetical protein